MHIHGKGKAVHSYNSEQRLLGPTMKSQKNNIPYISLNVKEIIFMKRLIFYRDFRDFSIGPCLWLSTPKAYNPVLTVCYSQLYNSPNMFLKHFTKFIKIV